MRHRLATLTLVVLALGCVAACQGRTLWQPAPNGSGSGAVVSLSAADLAPVDSFVSARNSQWILGDDIEVVASREYFAQTITVNATLGTVKRRDVTSVAETSVHLTFMGPSASANLANSPRLLVGTGITVTARKTLLLRLVKTRDASRPVSILVTANGEAARGRGEEVVQRGPQLRLGGTLRKDPGGWRWDLVR